MKTEILALALLASCAVGLPNGVQYPAGVDPRSCPNYPNCDNAALHHGTAAGSGTRSWDSPPNSWGSWNHWNHETITPAVSTAAQYPAGVNPQSCPNYPNCDNAVLHGGAFGSHDNSGSWGSTGSSPAAAAWNSAPNNPPAQAPPQYPAGVNAQTCPNYPYC